MSETVSVNVRFPKELHRAVKALSEAEDRSLNGQILACLRACVEGRHRTPSGASLPGEPGGRSEYTADSDPSKQEEAGGQKAG